MLDHQKERKCKNGSVVLVSLTKLPVVAILVVWTRRSKQNKQFSRGHQLINMMTSLQLRFFNSDPTLRLKLTLVNSYYVESTVETLKNI